MDKSSLRAELIGKLCSLSDENLLSLCFSLTDQIVKFLQLYPELTQVTGAAYLPLKAEVAPMYQELLRKVPVSLAFPVNQEGSMTFAIPEGKPSGTTWLKPPYHMVNPSWFLIPGLGFDLGGGRLGRGKGFYDRYLSGHQGLRIALCWTEQIVEKVPVDGHDCRMDFIITENFCWDVNQQKRF